MITSSAPPTKTAACAPLTLRVPAADPIHGFDDLLARHHPLGAGRPVGDSLRQVVEQHGQPVALLVWGPVAYALKDRDRGFCNRPYRRLSSRRSVLQPAERCGLENPPYGRLEWRRDAGGPPCPCEISGLVTALGTAAFGVVTSAWHVLLARATAWFGRGARTPARKALLAAAVTPETYGRAFGFKRMTRPPQ